ncbi:D-alanine--D-alanyl carrier protein ligase [Streptomyces violaceorubidus]
MRPEDRFSQVHETTFDLAMCDIFPAWAGGACVCVLSRLQALDPARWVRRYGLTVWHSTPSLARGLQRADRLAPGSLAGLRQSVFAGEPLHVDTARYWQRAAPDGVLDNIYGPTELTIACTAFRWHPGQDLSDPGYGATVPIGVANTGMEAMLLGPDGSPADGTGELVMTGAPDVPRLPRTRPERGPVPWSTAAGAGTAPGTRCAPPRTASSTSAARTPR